MGCNKEAVVDMYGMRGALMPQHVLLRAVPHAEGQVGRQAARGAQRKTGEDDVDVCRESTVPPSSRPVPARASRPSKGTAACALSGVSGSAWALPHPTASSAVPQGARYGRRSADIAHAQRRERARSKRMGPVHPTRRTASVQYLNINDTVPGTYERYAVLSTFARRSIARRLAFLSAAD